MLSGEEWNEYFKQTYGAENVTWKANSFEHIIQHLEVLYDSTQAEIAKILGDGWTAGTYGSAGTGWKYTNGIYPSFIILVVEYMEDLTMVFQVVLLGK